MHAHINTSTNMHQHASTAVKSTLSSRLGSVQLHREVEPSETKLRVFNSHPPLFERPNAWQNSQVILIRFPPHALVPNSNTLKRKIPLPVVTVERWEYLPKQQTWQNIGIHCIATELHFLHHAALIVRRGTPIN